MGIKELFYIYLYLFKILLTYLFIHVLIVLSLRQLEILPLSFLASGKYSNKVRGLVTLRLRLNSSSRKEALVFTQVFDLALLVLTRPSRMTMSY